MGVFLHRSFHGLHQLFCLYEKAKQDATSPFLADELSANHSCDS